jgi:hypothetical protein
LEQAPSSSSQALQPAAETFLSARELRHTFAITGWGLTTGRLEAAKASSHLMIKPSRLLEASLKSG